MSDDKEQRQDVSDNSTAIQAARDVNITNTGLSYSDVRDAALDVFKSNFYELAGMAKETAKARAEEITESFLSKLQKEYPEGFNKSNDPDFQHSLFTVQKEYARSGDRYLGDLLVDLLIDRSKRNQRDVLQIVLNESLNTAPKLTENHLAALAVIFLFRFVQSFKINNQSSFGEFLDKYILPFASDIVKNNSCYQHLEFSGCGYFGASTKLENIIRATYPGLFLNGFEEREIKGKDISIGLDERFFTICLNNPKKMQVRAMNIEELEKSFNNHTIPSQDRAKIKRLFNDNRMNITPLRRKCIEIRPYMANIFEVWSESPMNTLHLTSVGIAIGHANIKRLVGEFANLSIWIN